MLVNSICHLEWLTKLQLKKYLSSLSLPGMVNCANALVTLRYLSILWLFTASTSSFFAELLARRLHLILPFLVSPHLLCTLEAGRGRESLEQGGRRKESKWKRQADKWCLGFALFFSPHPSSQCLNNRTVRQRAASCNSYRVVGFVWWKQRSAAWEIALLHSTKQIWNCRGPL